MRALVILDHPYTAASAENVPHQRSFTAAVARAAITGLERGGHVVDLVDLVADGFDPVMRREDLVAWRLQEPADDALARDYQARVAAADRILFVFPIWWEAMPASTKGFMDKVIAKGIAYRELPDARGNPFVSGLPRLRGVDLLTVMTTPTAAYRWWFGNPVTKIMFRGGFGKIGVRNLRWFNYASVTAKTSAQRERMLWDTEERYAAL